MNPTRTLHDLGQSLWLDTITRELLSTGTLQRYIDEWSVTGLTSNPTIFAKALSSGSAYDDQVADLALRGVAVDEARFRQEMAVMAAQRNAKIVGIFARLYSRDGKTRYLAFLPRVWGYLERDLAHPALSELRAWYDRTIPKDLRSADLRRAVDI